MDLAWDVFPAPLPPCNMHTLIYLPLTGNLGRTMAKVDAAKEYNLDLGHESFNFAEINRVIELARGAPGLKLFWVMMAQNDKKWVQPVGLMLTTDGVIHVKPLKEHYFE